MKQVKLNKLNKIDIQNVRYLGLIIRIHDQVQDPYVSAKFLNSIIDHQGAGRDLRNKKQNVNERRIEGKSKKVEETGQEERKKGKR